MSNIGIKELGENYYLFLDESGNHDLSNINPEYPAFLLCGVLMTDLEFQNLDSRFKGLKKKYWDSEDIILHSRDIRKCQKDFRILFDSSIKEAFYEDLNRHINESLFEIISSAILKDKYIEFFGKLSNDVYEISLSFIIERAVFCLDENYNTFKKLHIILESRGVREDNLLREHFQRLMSRGTKFIDPDRFRALNIKLHFRAKKKNVNGLQLADLIAYPTTRHVLNMDKENLAFEVFRNKFYCNKKGSMYGAGLKIFP